MQWLCSHHQWKLLEPGINRHGIILECAWGKEQKVLECHSIHLLLISITPSCAGSFTGLALSVAVHVSQALLHKEL
eukprot:11184091-Lingulodinium_polyedra.AAC.1